MLELAQDALPWVGVLAFALIMRGRRPKPTPKDPNEPVCGCKHQLAMHDPESNACHAEAGFHWEGTGASHRRISHRCPCRQYVGPRPIDQVFQPRILPPSGEHQ